jgi:hypothetical protein
MSLPVTIENESLRVVLYPTFGGKILSIIDRADEYELLFDYPTEFPTSPQYDQPYIVGYHAGWDECFPAVGAGPYPTHPYKGINVPDHGELWGLPPVVAPIKSGIITEWMGLRFGYRFSRKLWVEGPSLVAEYSLQNLAPFDFHFVWSQHPLASVHSPVELEMPRGVYRLSHDGEGKRFDTPFDWPITASGDRLSKPEDLPPKRGWKIFSLEPISTPAVVRYPARNRSLTIEYSSPDALAAYWGVWINTGWGGQKHISVEPTTGRFDELDRSFKDGSAGCVASSGKLGWTVRWTVR